MQVADKKYVIQIMWHLNDECNLRCTHCYDEKKFKSLTPIDRWSFQCNVIDRIVELGQYYNIIRVGLLGGEPLFDPNIFRIIAKLREKGIARIDISTNGILVTSSFACQLKNAGIQLIQVSLDGPNPKVNDVIRGNGNFSKALPGLRNLVAAGIETGIMTTVYHDNLHHMEEMVKLAAREKLKIISFNRFLPIGRGKKSKLQPLTDQELKQMITLVHQLDKQYLGLDVSSDDPLLYVPVGSYAGSNNTCGGCGAGIGNLAICHDGTVFPCRRLPIAVGNIQKISLLDIINSQQMDCFYSRHSFLEGKCGACQHQSICGGCRAAAYAFTSNHLGSDPQCWLNAT